MSANDTQPELNVHLRYRPLTEPDDLIEAQFYGPEDGLKAISVQPEGEEDRHWTSRPVYKICFSEKARDMDVFDDVIAPTIPHVLAGGNSNFFDYGDSDIRQFRTINYMALRAGKQLFNGLDALNKADDTLQLGISLSLFDMEKHVSGDREYPILDMLDPTKVCQILVRPDGKIKLCGFARRGSNTCISNPLSQQACWSFESLHQEINASAQLRLLRSWNDENEVHDDSHMVLKLEIVSKELLKAREELMDRESEFILVDWGAFNINAEEKERSMTKDQKGELAPNPNYQMDEDRIAKAFAEKAKCEARVDEAEAHIDAVIRSSKAKCVGAKMLFVNLAGSEYYREEGFRTVYRYLQPREQTLSNYASKDLVALKEVLRAWSLNRSRIPFLSSPLTMAIRENFINDKGVKTNMVINVSLGEDQYPTTVSALKYGSSVGMVES